MSLYTLSDLHLSLGTDKPMDCFRGWDNYVQLIKTRWEELVTEQDTVVLPGDLSWAMKLEETAKDMAFINALPGKKVLVKGNHDLWFTTKTKVENYFVAQGFDTLQVLFNSCVEYEDYVLCGTRGWINEQGEAVDKKILNREAGRLRLSLQAGVKTGKTPIVFLHYPPIYGDQICYEMIEVLQEFGVKRCYYGHLHGSSFQYAINGERHGIHFQLVSCDFVQFTPQKVL